MSALVLERIEKYIWGSDNGKIDSILVQDSTELEKLLLRVEEIQGNLNVRLKREVEENYSTLLEKVEGLESVEKVQSVFQKQVESVFSCTKLATTNLDRYIQEIKSESRAIKNLTNLKQVLQSAAKCVDLINSSDNERNIFRRAESLSRLITHIGSSEKLKSIKWLNEQYLFRQKEMVSGTRDLVFSELISSLKSHNSSSVSLSIQALKSLYMEHNLCQKVLNNILDGFLNELDALLFQLISKSIVDEANSILPLISTKLHTHLEQSQLLGSESSQYFAKHVGIKIITRVPLDAAYAVRLIQTIFKCLTMHDETVSSVIRDSLRPLKSSVLSRSLSGLISTIEYLLNEEVKCSIIVEKLNIALKKELQSVNWDASLCKEMEGNVEKALKYFSVKVEQLLKLDDETLKFGWRPTKAQNANYELINAAFEMAKLWKNYASPICSIVESTLQILRDKAINTVSLVLESMHSEKIPPTSCHSSSCLEYAKELCDHLKVFRIHFALIYAFSEAEALSPFLNYVIEQFLLHTSLIRQTNIDQIIIDLEHICKELQRFECKYTTIVLKYDHIKELLLNIQNDVSLDKYKFSDSTPSWFIAQMLICSKSKHIPLPHESISWELIEYVNWFNTHSIFERYHFLFNLLNSYKQRVIADGGTEFEKEFPIAMELVEYKISHIKD